MEENIEKILTPIKAIRAKCLDCCCNQPFEVKLCPIKDCPLWNYRFGKNPFSHRDMSEEQRQKASERLKNYHRKKKVGEIE